MKMHSTVFYSESKIILKISYIPGMLANAQRFHLIWLSLLEKKCHAIGIFIFPIVLKV